MSPRNASITAVLVGTLTLNGCATGRTGIIAGAATVLLGTGLVVGSGSRGGCNTDHVLCPIFQEAESNSQAALGGLMILTGALVVLAGLATPNAEQPEHAPAPVAVVAPPSPQPVTPAVLEMRRHVQNRLAIQSSLTAHAGQCQAAAATARELAATDRELYQVLITTNAEVAHCLEQR